MVGTPGMSLCTAVGVPAASSAGKLAAKGRGGCGCSLSCRPGRKTAAGSAEGSLRAARTSLVLTCTGVGAGVLGLRTHTSSTTGEVKASCPRIYSFLISY